MPMTKFQFSDDQRPCSVDRRVFLGSAGITLVFIATGSVRAQTYTTPGVYIDEEPVINRPIRAAATSVAVFIDHFTDENVGEVFSIDNYGSFLEFAGRKGEAIYAEASAALRLFFVNGGGRAIIINVAAIDDVPDYQDGIRILAADPTIAFNLLSFPTVSLKMREDDSRIGSLLQRALTLCKERRAILLVDAPNDPRHLTDWKAMVSINDANVAVFAPGLMEIDCRRNRVSAGAAAAGVIARTDNRRGVWKAAAGTEARVHQGNLAVSLTDADNETMSRANVNIIRSHTAEATPVIWGSRTFSSDPEWRHLPVRRLALFLEESIYGSTEWVTSEQNAVPLWSSLELSIGSFLNTLFRQGAFQGASSENAYFVRCGLGSTMTQNDIDNNRLVCEIGFAPLRPTEFFLQRFVWTDLSD